MHVLKILVHEWVTGGGLAGEDLPESWAAEGNAMRRAIAADFAAIPGVQVQMTLDERLSDEPGPWTTHRLGVHHSPDAWAAIGAQADWSVLIAPETGGILANCSRTLSRMGGRSLGSTPEAIERASHKLNLSSYLKERGFKTPPCYVINPAHGLPGQPDTLYPAVLKPIDGAGSVDTFWVDSPHALPKEASGLGEALLQPFIPGIPSSASFLIGPDGPQLIAIGRQRMAIHEAKFRYEGGILPDFEAEPDASLTRALESIPGLRGFVGVDFIRSNGEPHDTVTILEINPRPTTSYVGLAQIMPPGTLANAWMSLFTGQACLEVPPLADDVRSLGQVTFNPDGTIERWNRRGDLQ